MPKNAPDSYGGKLEQPDIFARLINDVFANLKKPNSIFTNATPGNIVLAGHSGVYRVMAHITAKGGLPINEILLFDGLYSETEKYINWAAVESTASVCKYLHQRRRNDG